MRGPPPELSWRSLGEPALSAVTKLAQACLSADGGQPFADDPGFLRARYLGGAETDADWAGRRLVCVSSLRRAPAGLPPAGSPPDGDVAAPVTSGMVHPAWRRRGIGEHAFDWAAARAAGGRLRAETEALNEGAHALYVSRGLAQLFAEDVMQLAGQTPLPAAHSPRDLILSEWGQADPARFYAVYHEAFRERPGFPGWPQERWIEWISHDDDFRPEWTLLATLDGADVGFIAGEASGWIAQVGVVPRARRKDIGARLIAEVVDRMRSAGETSITLNVNVNNPGAAALYGRLGFRRIGRRARYHTPPDAWPRLAARS